MEWVVTSFSTVLCNQTQWGAAKDLKAFCALRGIRLTPAPLRRNPSGLKHSKTLAWWWVRELSSCGKKKQEFNSLTGSLIRFSRWRKSLAWTNFSLMADMGCEPAIPADNLLQACSGNTIRLATMGDSSIAGLYWGPWRRPANFALGLRVLLTSCWGKLANFALGFFRPQKWNICKRLTYWTNSFSAVGLAGYVRPPNPQCQPWFAKLASS